MNAPHPASPAAAEAAARELKQRQLAGTQALLAALQAAQKPLDEFWAQEDVPAAAAALLEAGSARRSLSAAIDYAHGSIDYLTRDLGNTTVSRGHGEDGAMTAQKT